MSTLKSVTTPAAAAAKTYSAQRQELGCSFSMYDLISSSSQCHFINKDTKAPRGEKSCPTSSSKQVVKPGFICLFPEPTSLNQYIKLPLQQKNEQVPGVLNNRVWPPINL